MMKTITVTGFYEPSAEENHKILGITARAGLQLTYVARETTQALINRFSS